jgi:hypothetical protein
MATVQRISIAVSHFDLSYCLYEIKLNNLNIFKLIAKKIIDFDNI